MPSTPRVYTVRAFDDLGTERRIVVDVIRHQHDSPVMQWVTHLRQGDATPFLGPRQHFAAPIRDGRPTVLLADEWGPQLGR